MKNPFKFIKLITFLFLISLPLLTFSQTFTKDANGTVKCTGCSTTGTVTGTLDGDVSGDVYTSHTNATLSLKSKGESDWNRVVTSLVTDMSYLFVVESAFNQDISN